MIQRFALSPCLQLLIQAYIRNFHMNFVGMFMLYLYTKIHTV